MTKAMWFAGLAFLSGFLFVTVGGLVELLQSDTRMLEGQILVPGLILGGGLAVLTYGGLRGAGLEFPTLAMDSVHRPGKRFFGIGAVVLLAASVAGGVPSGDSAKRRDVVRLAAVAANERARAAMTPAELEAERAAAVRLRAASEAEAALQRSAATQTVSDASRPAWKLAVIDHSGNQHIPLSVLQVYGLVMDRLVAKCPESEGQIGDVVVVSAQGLRDKGVSMNNLEFMETLDKSIPLNIKEKLGVKCAETAAILWTLIDRK
jgi:hypothetical protein